MQYDVNNFDFICVSGYGKSGSSACVDLLKEFEYIDGPDKEFRIAKDPYGLLDLELSIVDNWEFIRHNMAINDFLEYCSMLSRKDGTLKRAGKNFSKILSVDFTKESTEYIKRITDFMYFGDTMLNRYYLNALQSFIQRLRSKFGLSNTALMYFACPSEDNFLIETRRYLRKLFENYAKNKKIYKIVLDQAISPTNISKTLRYFGNTKLIIVDRDPRDIYATMINKKMFLGASNNSIDKYIAWHHSVRKQTSKDIGNVCLQGNVLRLNFEDFFLHYERTIGEIKKFLNIEFSHKEKGIRFNCEDIDKHVGIWKNMPQRDAMKKIGEELKKDCYVG